MFSAGFKFSALGFRTRIEHFSQVQFSTEHGCFVTVTVKISPVTCANQAKLQHHRNDFGPTEDDLVDPNQGILVTKLN